MALRPVVRLDFLESIRRDLLIQLLKSNSEACKRHGIVLQTSDSESQAWDARSVYQFIHREYPQPLTSTLLQIRDLSEDPDVDYFGEELGFESAQPPWTAAERASLVYLNNPIQFQKIHLSALPVRSCQFVEFAGPTPASFNAEDPARVLEFQRNVGAWFDHKHCTNHCEVYALQTSAEVRWGIVHGRRPRSQGKIKCKNGPDTSRKISTFFPDQHDLIILCLNTGRLLINARSMDEVDLYRKQIGEIYWGSTDQFAVTHIYSLKPFQAEGEMIFSCKDIEGIERVELRQIDFRKPQAKTVTFNLKGKHLCQDIPGIIDRFLKDFAVHSIKIACYADKKSEPQMITVKPPNRISFDVRTENSAAMKFLIARGMMTVDLQQAPLFKTSRR